MDTYEAILHRRSIRKYLKDPVPIELIQKVMTAAMWAPSGGNSQPWRFYVATGSKRDELINALIEASGTDTPTAEEYDRLVEIVEKERLALLGKSDSSGIGVGEMSKERTQFARFGSLRFYDAPVAIIVATPKRMGQASHQSIGAAVQNILLAAHAEGLATCWLGMPLAYKEKIIEVLDIPDDEVLVTSISLGYPDKKSPITKTVMPRQPFDKVVHIRS